MVPQPSVLRRSRHQTKRRLSARWLLTAAAFCVLAAACTIAPTRGKSTAPAPDHEPPEGAPLEREEAFEVTVNEGYVDVDGTRRYFDVQTPQSDSRVPVVIDLHGHGSSGTGDKSQRQLSGFAELGAAEGFAVVWPDGRGTSWNAGRCCGTAADDEVDDVGFLRALVAHLVENENVDSNRVYVSGFSNGCAMAQRFAVEASDVVAAVACMALYVDPLISLADDYQPVPVMQIHGLNDAVVPYTKGPLGGAIQNIDIWVGWNKCDRNSPNWSDATDNVRKLSFDGCENGSEVTHLTVKDAAHFPYGGFDTDTDTTVMAWEFMERFTLDRPRSPGTPVDPDVTPVRLIDPLSDEERLLPAPGETPVLPTFVLGQDPFAPFIEEQEDFVGPPAPEEIEDDEEGPTDDTEDGG